MNKIIIKGRLVRDPELHQTQSNISVCSISVAVDRSYNPDGQRTADFFDCIFWRQGAEFVSKYFRKGQEILIDGEMQSRHYEGKDGVKRTAWEVQNCHAEFCGSKADNDSASHGVVVNTDFTPIEDDSADLPF